MLTISRARVDEATGLSLFHFRFPESEKTPAAYVLEFLDWEEDLVMDYVNVAGEGEEENLVMDFVPKRKPVRRTVPVSRAFPGFEASVCSDATHIFVLRSKRDGAEVRSYTVVC